MLAKNADIVLGRHTFSFIVEYLVTEKRSNMRDSRKVKNWEVEGGRNGSRKWGKEGAIDILRSSGL